MNATAFLPAALLASAALAAPAAAAPRTLAVRVAATEVSFKKPGIEHADAIAQAIRDGSAAEGAYYDPALPAAVMRVRIDKVGFKSAGKALAQNLPLVGLFSGANENVLKGEVQLIDQASGRLLAKYKIQADDYTDFSAADAGAEYAKMGLGFLPFGGLLSAAVDVGQSAANKRDATERMLTRGFVMLSYQKTYGTKLYKSFGPQRKIAWSAQRAAEKAAATPLATATPATRVAAAGR